MEGIYQEKMQRVTHEIASSCGYYSDIIVKRFPFLATLLLLLNKQIKW